MLAVEDLREPVRSRTVGRTVVVAVDASGSMGTHQRVEAATGAVLGLLADAYLRRDRVAMVTFRADSAEVVLPPTASVELARTRLAELPTGGVTPLAEGITAGLVDRPPGRQRRLAAAAGAHHRRPGHRPRAGGRPAPPRRRPREVAAPPGWSVVVVDAEDGPTRLGLAEQLATDHGRPPPAAWRRWRPASSRAPSATPCRHERRSDTPGVSMLGRATTAWASGVDYRA